MDLEPPPINGLLKPAIDLNLPTIELLSMRQWNETYRRLSRLEDKTQRDTFAITGHFTGEYDGRRYRAKFDSSSCQLTEDHVFHQHCDIDSAIGIIYEDFPIKATSTLKYYMLMSASHTLTSNVHLPDVKIPHPDGHDERAALGTLPNARFAEIGDQVLIRWVFPRARDVNKGQTQPNCMLRAQMALLYDHAVQPAAIDILPEDLRRNWPAEYSDETWRARRRVQRHRDDNIDGDEGENHLQHTARDVHGQYINPWITRIRERVNAHEELSWAQDFFFAVELRGVKNRNESIHPPPDEVLVNEEGELIDPQNPRTMAIEGLLSDFDIDQFAPGCWFLDIATTVSVSEDIDASTLCAFPAARMHPEIINHFTAADLSQCQRWVQGTGGCYQSDEIAHLGDMAGLRIDIPGAGSGGVHYFQVYTSDKSVTYNINNIKNAKRTSAGQIIEDWKNVRNNHFLPMINAFHHSSATHSVVVRFESRLSYEYYPLLHLIIPWPALRYWLLVMSNSAFWGWKFHRLLSIENIINEWVLARETFTLDILPETLSLLVLLTWMANSLVNRPDDGGHWDEVRDSGSVHIVIAGRVVPDRPLVIYYAHSLRLQANAMPRTSSNRVPFRRTLIYLSSWHTGQVTELEIFNAITNTRPQVQKPLPRDPWGVAQGEDLGALTISRQGNKQREVRITSAIEVPNEFAGVLQEPERAGQFDSEDEDAEERETATPRGLQLSQLIHNYPVQIFAKVPESKVLDASWCTLSPYERMKVDMNVFSDLDELARIFPRRAVFSGDPSRWDNAVINLFPDLQGGETHIQGRHTLRVFKDWMTLLASVDPPLRSQVVQEARRFVNERWRWLPARAKNHLWTTGAAGLPKKAVRFGEVGGPWIVINPYIRG